MRLIHTGTESRITFSVQDHDLTIVAVDGEIVDPLTVSDVLIDPGVSYDVVLHTQQSSATTSYVVSAATTTAKTTFAIEYPSRKREEMEDETSVPKDVVESRAVQMPDPPVFTSKFFNFVNVPSFEYNISISFSDGKWQMNSKR
jgi:FtsP/CotA-like multicopper oxidase with cupredoxin domain